jgi:cobyrinic acid a,c-diamide synthase
MDRLMLSAAHRSSGKTTLAIGLCAALVGRGRSVQTFKKGPDYIDPMWLARASGRDCFNLDPALMQGDEIARLFARRAAGSGLALVEGNLGLYDGLALDGSDSNAALARQLGLPVVLVIDARGTSRGVAPLLLGYQAFDRQVRIAGVILNHVGGARHEEKLRAAIEHYTDIEVIGAVQQDERVAILERELGLIPSNEARQVQAKIDAIGAAVASQVDLERLQAVAHDAGAIAEPAAPSTAAGAARAYDKGARLRVGIATDQAFGFYYADDLEALRAAGAELVPFDTLHDAGLPAVQAIFIGGGFPEHSAAELEANGAMRAQIRAAIEGGLPVYAECGGLMYLARSIHVGGRGYSMVGAIDADVLMHRRPIGKGYVELEPTGEAPWCPGGEGGTVRGHEFHYSSMHNVDPGMRYAYRVRRGYGVDGEHDGLLVHNVLASYSHLRSVGGCEWPRRFVEFARRVAAQAAQQRLQRPLRPAVLPPCMPGMAVQQGAW